MPESLRTFVSASESPAGFMTFAAVGLIAVLLLNIENATETKPASIKEQGASHNTSLPSDTIPHTESHDAAESTLALETKPNPETFKLKRGETLINLLTRANIDSRNAHLAVSAMSKVTNMRKLRAGQNISLVRTSANSREIEELRIRDVFAEEAVTLKNQDGYKAERQPLKTYGLTHLVEGTIDDNLYVSAKAAGLPDKVIIDLIRMLSFDVDFEREIRKGDTFRVYFERSYAPSFNDIDEGRILYAELAMRRGTVDAFFYEDEHGQQDYFDSTGKSTRRALMKTPLDVAVITSSYGSRKHPVLGYTRMHKGVDFRAPTGTPIMAAGDGIIEMAARNGSYGNYVRIRHNGSYKTAYAHMSRYGRGIKKGVRVKQGQIIGYSGATGRVTAAHLHYEVMLDGKQVNPMTMKLPTGRALSESEMLAFNASKEVVLAEIEQARGMKTLLYAETKPNQPPLGQAPTSAAR